MRLGLSQLFMIEVNSTVQLHSVAIALEAAYGHSFPCLVSPALSSLSLFGLRHNSDMIPTG